MEAWPATPRIGDPKRNHRSHAVRHLRRGGQRDCSAQAVPDEMNFSASWFCRPARSTRSRVAGLKGWGNPRSVEFQNKMVRIRCGAASSGTASSTGQCLGILVPEQPPSHPRGAHHTPSKGGKALEKPAPRLPAIRARRVTVTVLRFALLASRVGEVSCAPQFTQRNTECNFAAACEVANRLTCCRFPPVVGRNRQQGYAFIWLTFATGQQEYVQHRMSG